MEKLENKNNLEATESLGIAETRLYPLVNQRLQDRYDRIATKWSSDVYEGTRMDSLIPSVLDLIQEKISTKEGAKVLEAMAGTALLGGAVKNHYPKSDVYALDFSRGMLNQIHENIHAIQASVVAMPFPDKVFDVVLLRNALYDLPRRLQKKALEEIHRVLADDGIFILQHYYTTPETFECYNELVKRKDIAASQNEDMGEERFSRYFATIDEFESWLTETGFHFSKEKDFEGVIRCMKATEMLDANLWRSYAESLPDVVKAAIKLKPEADGTLSYNFPGVVYKISKK
jgi:ubiquinone/menaquinone biosynthesis C-methylase UbiE